MKLFGWELTFRRAEKALPSGFSGLSGILANRGGWLPIIRESFAGAFQQNITIDRNLVLTHFAVFSCMTLIASDIAKLRLRLVQRDDDGIWTEADNPAYSPVLRKPNSIQTRIQFWESWMLAKLSNGNVYVLKGRDGRGVVTSLHVLDPQRVQVLVSEDGEVFYQLASDNISGVLQQITVPAREIVHDRMNCLFHPLVGLSPITAAGLAATQGLNIQRDATFFFGNRSVPGGILTAPAAISNETAERLKTAWQENYGGENAGKVAVLGDGLSFEPMRVTAHDAQVVEQLKWTAEVVCSVFHVPMYKIGLGALPTYNNIQALNVEYYSQALQVLIEAAELAMDEGLRTGEQLGTEFDISDLLRMDEMTQITVAKEGVSAGVFKPNEARRRMNLKPVEGGDTPYLQQQNYSLAALNKRDQRDDPFATATAPGARSPAPGSAEQGEPPGSPAPEAAEQDEPAAPAEDAQAREWARVARVFEDAA
jgi:HK97 family phage portal protein